MVFPGTLTNKLLPHLHFSFVNCENLQGSDCLFLHFIIPLVVSFQRLDVSMNFLALADLAESCLISWSQSLLLHLFVFRCIIYHIPDSAL